MAQRWWEKLPAAQRREYERSTAIARVPLRASPVLRSAVETLERVLRADLRNETEEAAAHLVSLICRDLGVPSVAIRVEGVRPHDAGGELHGLYRSSSGGSSIVVWMRTAKRRDVVATRTFLRTLLHEVCHHLDISLLDLPSSYHTPGFYRRESSLFRIVARGTPLAPKTRGRADEAPARPAESERRTGDPGTDEVDGIALLRAAAEAIQSRRDRITPRRD
jgi:hypothetical protein